ncbi:Protein suppressor of white apricot [Pseudolycoriella hygida]|uniref:Protein suppressor of white apricot n=1 Tax=Pseudolycoriella hygida TaxID=35572 RepID=A0A9Q0RWC0_9DIPT|nr:Protein suppressor of white apricot [Pseudolycoriella hygida]
MSDKWLSGTSSESGILRKTKTVQHTAVAEELLIFGYAAKLFRNDEQARLIDHGKHLIPWNGDNTLKIDRYDVRATLSDLQPYECPSGGYTNRLDYLTPAEQKAEQLCEEERYRSLYDNDVDEDLYREEESKRSQSSYQQIAFNYDGNNEIEEKEEPKDEEPDEIFVPNPKFYIPEDVEIPQSLKHHSIIEKTAKFIAAQGPQMEILIKAKQSNNPLFEFLNQNNRMNSYYKHLMNAIKSNTYPTTDEKEDIDDSSNDINATEHVIKNSLPDIQYQPIPVPTLKYKPSADCSYTQLISKIKGVPLPLNQIESASEMTPTSTSDISDPQSCQYGSPIYSSGETTTQAPVTPIVPQPTAAILPTSEKLMLDLNHEKIKATIQSKAQGVEINKISTGLMLAQCYNSDSESDDDGTDASNKMPKIEFPIPHPDLQNIIDKTAAYVLKNGREFENILRTKNDARFSFLSPTDEYHRYYIYKVSGVIYPTTSSTQAAPQPQLPSTIPFPTTSPKVITSVSFSIKPKDDQAISLKPALPQEPSSDEDESNNVPSIAVPASFEPVCRSTIPTKLSLQDIINVTIPPPTILRVNGIEPPKLLEDKLIRINHKIEIVPDTSDVSIRDAILENSVPADDKKVARRAEEKFKDRLAQVAREKLGMLSKEKQLQIERKKKAMAFLSQIKSASNQTAVENISLPESPKPTKHTSLANPIAAIEKQSTTSSLHDSDATIESVHSSPRVTVSSTMSKAKVSSDDDVEEIFSRQSRSRSKSISTSGKRKKSKHRSKKKSKRKASRSRSRSSNGRDRKHKKRSSSKKRRRDRDD